jgi:hypothetical protein
MLVIATHVNTIVLIYRNLVFNAGSPVKDTAVARVPILAAICAEGIVVEVCVAETVLVLVMICAE